MNIRLVKGRFYAYQFQQAYTRKWDQKQQSALDFHIEYVFG